MADKWSLWFCRRWAVKLPAVAWAVIRFRRKAVATPESESFVRTFARGLLVIEVLGQTHGGQSLAEVAEKARLPRTAVRRFLLTLIDMGFVRTDGKRYRLTPRVLRIGLSYLSSLPYWRDAQLALEELRARIDQSCALSVLDGEDLVYVLRQHAKRILPMSPSLGSRLPAHAVSMGRVLLAGLSDAELDAYLAGATFKRLAPAPIPPSPRHPRARRAAATGALARARARICLGPRAPRRVDLRSCGPRSGPRRTDRCGDECQSGHRRVHRGRGRGPISRRASGCRIALARKQPMILGSTAVRMAHAGQPTPGWPGRAHYALSASARAGDAQHHRIMRADPARAVRSRPTVAPCAAVRSRSARSAWRR